MKTVLLGGMLQASEAALSQALGQVADPIQVVVLPSLHAFRKQLETSADLLVLDLDEAKPSGLAWLAMLAEHRSSIPVVALGTDPQPDIKGFDSTFPQHYFPLIHYLQKPVGTDVLMQAIESELRQATWGIIQGLSLPSLLQMIQLEQKTCTIRVTSGRRQGFLYLLEGAVINARYRRLEGLDAAHLLIAAPAPRMEIDPHLHDAQQTIHARLEELLMEAAQRMDEGTPEPVPVGSEPSDVLPASEIGRWDRGKTAPKAPPPPRKRATWAWAIPLVALPLVAGVGWLLMPRSAQIQITSQPPGAVVRLDGKEQGRTPLQVTAQKPVSGTLSVQLSGYQDQAHPLRSEDRTVHFSLEPIPVAPVAQQPAASPEPAAPPVRLDSPKEIKRPKSTPKAPEPGKPTIFDQLRDRK